MSITLDTNVLFDEIKAKLEERAAANGTAVALAGQASATALAASLCAAARDAAAQKPDLLANAPAKAMNPVIVNDPAEITKSWFTSVLQEVETFGPVVVRALSKDFTPAAIGWNDVLASAPPERLADKDWVDFTARMLSQLVPAALQAIQGTKDFTDPASVPDLQIPEGKDKGWFSDAIKICQIAGPLVMAVV